MSHEYKKQYLAEKETIRTNVLLILLLKYLDRRANFAIEVISQNEVVFGLGNLRYYVDLTVGGAKIVGSVSTLSKYDKQCLEVFAEELYFLLHKGWEIARHRKAKERYFDKLKERKVQPELLPETSTVLPSINWDIAKAHTPKDEYQRQPQVTTTHWGALSDIVLLSFTATRVRYQIDTSVITILPEPIGHYDPEGKQYKLLPTRILRALLALAEDLMSASRNGSHTKRSNDSQAESLDKLHGFQTTLL